MSVILHFASDTPLAARPNPHERLLSVNEALAAGVADIPAFLLEDGFDRDQPDVILCCDREIHIDVDHNTIEDGGYDDDFSIFPTEWMWGMASKKAYFAILEWTECTPGRAQQVIAYIQEHLRHASELELWHLWLDTEEPHRLQKVVIPIGELTAEDILELTQTDVTRAPMTDYCYRIVR